MTGGLRQEGRRLRLTRRVAFAAVAMVLGAIAGIAAVRALAATYVLSPPPGDCPTSLREYGTFWKMLTSNAEPSYGAQNYISRGDHALRCVSPTDGLNGTGQTSRVMTDITNSNYYEAGWGEYFCATGAHCYRGFTEPGYGGHGTAYFVTFPCSPTPNVVEGWRVQSVGTTWYATVLCAGAYTWRSFGQAVNMGTSTGVPDSEAFRRDGNDDGEAHTGLAYRTAYGSWAAPVGLACRRDTDPYYGAAVDTTRSWHTVQDGRVGC
jgi:hypothetical protein